MLFLTGNDFWTNCRKQKKNCFVDNLFINRLIIKPDNSMKLKQLSNQKKNQTFIAKPNLLIRGLIEED